MAVSHVASHERGGGEMLTKKQAFYLHATTCSVWCAVVWWLTPPTIEPHHWLALGASWLALMFLNTFIDNFVRDK